MTKGESKAGTQQINDSHLNAPTYGIDLHRLESVWLFANANQLIFITEL